MAILDRLRGLVAPVPAAPAAAPPRGLPLRDGAAGNGERTAYVDYRAPHPLSVSAQQGIDTLYGEGQAGKLGNIRWGEKSATWEGHSYAGDLGPLQRYAGGQLVGTLATQRNSAAMEAGLPATSTVPGQPANPMLALLIQNNYVEGMRL